MFFMGPLICLFWTSGDISSAFQSQNEQPYSHLAEAYMMRIPRDSPWQLTWWLVTVFQQKQNAGFERETSHITVYRTNHLANSVESIEGKLHYFSSSYLSYIIRDIFPSFPILLLKTYLLWHLETALLHCQIFLKFQFCRLFRNQRMFLSFQP